MTHVKLGHSGIACAGRLRSDAKCVGVIGGVINHWQAELVKLSLRSSPEIEERLATLGVSRSLAAEDKRYLLALIDAQEAQLAEWLESVKDARAVIEKHHQNKNPEGQ